MSALEICQQILGLIDQLFSFLAPLFSFFGIQVPTFASLCENLPF